MINRKKKHNFCFKIIALVIVCLLLINNIAWAYPDRFKLSAQSIFNPLRSKQITDIGIIKYYLSCLKRAFPSFDSIPGDINTFAGKNGFPLTLAFSQIPAFKTSLQLEKNNYVIPCIVNRTMYYAYISLTEKDTISDITVFTKNEFKKISGDTIAHGNRSKREEEKIIHEEKYDAPLSIAHRDKKDMKEVSQNLQEEALEFFRLFGAGEEFLKEAYDFMRAEEALTLTRKQSDLVFYINDKEYSFPDIVVVEKAHASNRYINIPQDTYDDITKILIHELSAKCGNSDDFNLRLDKVYDQWNNAERQTSIVALNPDIKKVISAMRFKDLRRIKKRDYNAEKLFEARKRKIRFIEKHDIFISILMGIAFFALSFYLLNYWPPSPNLSPNEILSSQFLLSGLLGAVGSISSLLVILSLSVRYPLKEIEPGAIVDHVERKENIEKIKRALEFSDEQIAEAYDTMVSDIYERAQNRLLPPDSVLTMFFIEAELAYSLGFFPRMIERNAPIKINIYNHTLSVEKKGKKRKYYKLVYKNGDYSDVKVIIPTAKGDIEKDINLFIRDISGVTVAKSFAEISGMAEVGGIGVLTKTEQKPVIFHYGFRRTCIIGRDGNIIAVGVDTDTTSFSDPSRSPRVMKRYGNLMFGYHIHPDDTEPSPGDETVIKERCETFNRIIPEIIWEKKDANTLHGCIYLPIRKEIEYPERPLLLRFLLKHEMSFIVLIGALFSIMSLCLLPEISPDKTISIIIVSSLIGVVFSITAKIVFITQRIKYPTREDYFTVQDDFAQIDLPVTILPSPPPPKAELKSGNMSKSHPKEGGSPTDYLMALDTNPNLQEKHTFVEYKEKVKPVVSDSTIRRDRKALEDRTYLKRGKYLYRKGNEYTLTENGKNKIELIKNILAKADKSTQGVKNTVINLALSLENGEKALLAIDENLAKEGTLTLIRKLIRDICDITEDEKLRIALKNIIIISKRGEILAEEVSKYTTEGKNGIKIHPSNVLMITNAAQEYYENHYRDLIQHAIITFVDDSKLDMMDYYPLIEIIFFTLAKALYHKGVNGYDANKLISLYKNLNIEHTEAAQIIPLCIDKRTITIVLRPIESFNYDELQHIYRRIREFLRAA